MKVWCVKTGTLYGPEYVTNLYSMILRHLPPADGWEFTCLTNEPVDGIHCEPLKEGLDGWWAKLEAFKRMAEQPSQVHLLLDLDIVVLGDLRWAAKLAGLNGIACIKDWWYDGFNSSVVGLNGFEARRLWEEFNIERMRITTGYRSDQEWLTAVRPRAFTFPPPYFPSYKADKLEAGPSPGALAVIFHGKPKPHEFTEGWVANAWK